jgi:hypothetical protein
MKIWLSKKFIFLSEKKRMARLAHYMASFLAMLVQLLNFLTLNNFGHMIECEARAFVSLHRIVIFLILY